jgi:hypothetical protein
MVGVRLRPEGSCLSVVTEVLFEVVRKGSSLLCFPSETDGVPEDLALQARSSLMEPNLEGASEATLSGLVFVVCSTFKVLSFDMPGRTRRAPNTLSAPLISSLLFLKAAFPSPLSAVCLKYAGSRAPNDAAIWSLEG